MLISYTTAVTLCTDNFKDIDTDVIVYIIVEDSLHVGAPHSFTGGPGGSGADQRLPSAVSAGRPLLGHLQLLRRLLLHTGTAAITHSFCGTFVYFMDQRFWFQLYWIVRYIDG